MRRTFTTLALSAIALGALTGCGSAEPVDPAPSTTAAPSDETAHHGDGHDDGHDDIDGESTDPRSGMVPFSELPKIALAPDQTGLSSGFTVVFYPAGIDEFVTLQREAFAAAGITLDVDLLRLGSSDIDLLTSPDPAAAVTAGGYTAWVFRGTWRGLRVEGSASVCEPPGPLSGPDGSCGSAIAVSADRPVTQLMVLEDRS